MEPQALDALAAALFVLATIGFAIVFRRNRAAIEAQERFDNAEKGIETNTSRGVLRLLVTPIAALFGPASQHDLDRIQTKLQNAGRRGRDEVDRFVEEKALWIVFGLLTAFAGMALVGGLPGLLLFLIFSAVGILGGEKVVELQAAERQNAVTRSLPGAVDLLVTCLDAGLSLEHAVARVAQDLAHSEPILAEELRITASEFEAGVALPDALRRLARRVGIDDLSAMCGVIAQASTLGAPVAQTLRDYALQSRKQRISMLEERAGKLSTRLTLPLALCLLPAAMLIMVGPAAIQLVKALK
jgi:tight adherence protein C